MTLIKSISGIRGTIGGKAGTGLSPLDVVKFSAAFGAWLKNKNAPVKQPKIVVGRDARISGEMINKLVIATLMGLGIDVIDIGLSTTPTVELAVPDENALGGIIITASHNPKQWNALKLLNEKGEFISAQDGAEVLEMAEKEDFIFSEVNQLGKCKEKDSYIDKHIEKILKLPLVNKAAIAARNYKIVIDCVNSTGALIVPKLLKTLGVENIVELYCTPNGDFPHNPEPLAENLTEIAREVKKQNADLGIVVDPDVDRLAFVMEDGEMFGEEYTLVAVADYVLKHKKGNTVSNMSSTMALKDVTEKYGCNYSAAAVGEVNVVEKMKTTNAVIGGEGNGGVIFPELHYGRDALVGIALFLSHLSTFKEKKPNSISELRFSYPIYHISKNKIELTPNINVDNILDKIAKQYGKENEINREDGVKIFFEKAWVQLRKSNTEPIIRIYAEGDSEAKAENLANKIIEDIRTIIKGKEAVSRLAD